MNTREYITIDQLESNLDDWFSGQKELKRILSVFGHMHVMRMKANLVDENRTVELPRPILFVSGRTGSGKTYCVQNFAKAMGLPYHRINASQLSQSGWSGVDLSEALEDYYNSNHSNRLKDYGVIFIDEIDKLSNRLHSSGGGDVSLAIQTSFLDILEGKEVSISKSKAMPTKNFLVILGGSFEEKIRAEENTKTIGFHSPSVHKQDMTEWKDFMMKSGMVPELVGRITDVYEMKRLSDDEIRDAILNMPDGPYTQYYNMAKMYDRHFYLGEEYIQQIIEKTRTSPFGLREINTQITRKAIEFMSKECRHTALDTTLEKEHNIDMSRNKPG